MANQASDILSLVTEGLAKDPVTTMALLLLADELQPGAFEQVMLAVQQTDPDTLNTALQTIQSDALLGDQNAALVLLAVSLKMLLNLLVAAAKHGAKLLYIKLLLGQCPEGMEMAYFKAGGKVCSKCVKALKKVKKDCGGNKFFKEGGISTLVNNFRTEHAYKCGGKVSKKSSGDDIVIRKGQKYDLGPSNKVGSDVNKQRANIREFLTKNTPTPKPTNNSKSNVKFSKETKLQKDRSANFLPAEGKCGMKVKKAKLTTKKCGGKVTKKSCGGKTTKKC